MAIADFLIIILVATLAVIGAFGGVVVFLGCIIVDVAMYNIVAWLF